MLESHMLDVSLYSTVYTVYTYRIVHTRFRFRLNIKPSQNNKRILLLYFNCMRFVFLCYCCRRCLCVQRKYLCWMSLFSVFWCLYVCFALHSSICIIFTFFRCVDDFKGHLWWSRQQTAHLTAFGWFSWLFYTKRREKKFIRLQISFIFISFVTVDVFPCHTRSASIAYRLYSSVELGPF